MNCGILHVGFIYVPKKYRPISFFYLKIYLRQTEKIPQSYFECCKRKKYSHFILKTH